MTDEQIIIDGKIIGCPCYIDRPLHRYHKGCLVQSQAFKEQQTEEKPILRCDEIKNCPIKENFKQLQCKTQECEKLKKQLMQKSEVDMFFYTPIEGWSNDPCGICPHKAENEELKKEIINKDEKIKELRFSVSDLTNRFCFLNAEKSFRIVDLEQTLDEIKSICLKDVHTFADGTQLRYDSLDEILDIINKAKDGE